MFCRFCGAAIPADSLFCAKCGRRLASGSRFDALLNRVYLKTPYPYAGLLFLAFVIWALQPARTRVDYSTLRVELELEAEAAIPQSDVYRHRLNLIIENAGAEPVADIPIEFRARVLPEQPVEVVSDFLGRRLVILRNGEVLPLVVILGDAVGAGDKRQYGVDGVVTTAAPAEVIYEVLSEGGDEVLARLSVPIGAGPGPGPGRPPPGPTA